MPLLASHICSLCLHGKTHTSYATVLHECFDRGNNVCSDLGQILQLTSGSVKLYGDVVSFLGTDTRLLRPVADLDVATVASEYSWGGKLCFALLS